MSKSCPIYKVNLGTFVPTNQMYIFSGNTLFGIKYVCGLRECAFNVGAAATCQPEVHQEWSAHKSNITADRRKEGNVLFNDELKTFYFTVIWRRRQIEMNLNLVRAPEGSDISKKCVRVVRVYACFIYLLLLLI